MKKNQIWTWKNTYAHLLYSNFYDNKKIDVMITQISVKVKK